MRRKDVVTKNLMDCRNQTLSYFVEVKQNELLKKSRPINISYDGYVIIMMEVK